MRRTELAGSRGGWVSGAGVRRLGLLALALFAAACSGDGNPTTVGRDVLPIGGPLADHNSLGDPGQCFGDDAVQYFTRVDGLNANSDPEDVNCTANDIDIAVAIVGGVDGIPNYQPGDPVQCTPGAGSTITLNMSAQLVQNANSDRQDIGVWIGTAQSSAITGQCNHYFLDTDLAGTFNGDAGGVPDHCSGMSVGASANLPLGNITVPCTAVTIDPPGDLQGPGTYLEVGACVSWKVPGADTECPDNAANDGAGAPTPEDFRAGTLLANKSKCNCEPFYIPLIIPGTITITKDAVPNDAQDFQFNTTGGSNLPGSFFLDDDAEGTLPASRTFNNLTPGTFTVTEAADPTGWQFGSLSCTSTGAGTSTSTASKTATITLAGGGTATCTYVNNRQGTITVIKDANPNDAQDFTFNTTGAAPLGGSFILDDDGEVILLSNTKVFSNVPLGSYTVTEAADPAGWQFGSLSCTSSGAGTSTSTAAKVATITIGAGGSATCTYVNNKQGSITIIKDAIPNDAQDFTFTTTGASPLGGSFLLDDDGEVVILSNTKVFNNVPLGSYTVTEAADPAGWQFGSLSCTSSGAGTSTSTAAKVATITIATGGSATCTYVNNKQGTITVIKDAVPNDAQDFTFTTTGAAPLGGSFLLDDDGEVVILSNTQVFNNVPLGTYTVTEAADPAGWQFGSMSCTSSGSGTSTSTAAKVATITIGSGGSATCTYVNNKQGTITVIKDANPNDAQDFTFNTTGAAPLGGSFLLDDDGEVVILSNTKVFSNVPLGSYTVTEAADPAGWSFNSLSCTSSGAGTSTSTATRVATITIGSGGSATCTYVNNGFGSITVIKDAVPNDGQDFTFNTTGAAPLGGSFLLDDDGETVILSNTKLFSNVPAGSYTVTEAADPTGWQFGSLSCTSSGAGTSTSTASKTATITLGAGGSATCTYVNNKQGTITIIKDAVPNDGQDFTFNTTGAAPLGGSFLLDDDGEVVILSNTKVFSNVPLGSYTVTEAADPTGWQFGSMSCTSSGSGTSTSTAAKVATITIGSGGSATCTYVNNKQGTITIIKDAVPNSAQDFTFNTTGAAPLGGSFLLDDDGEVILLSNTKVFSNVPLGSYTVTEAADPAGWAFGSLSCSSTGAGTSTSTATKTATITIGAGGTATCTYVNNELGTIIIEKETSDGSTTQTFSFTRRISPSTSDAGDNPNPTMTDGGSSSSGKKLAANTYRVCEVNLAAGWQNPTVTVNGTPTALSVTDLTTGTFCVQVVLAGGETDIVEFTNTPPPGGGTRTIGYWKNHASCSTSNGNQYQKTIDAGFPLAVTDPHINDPTDPFYTQYPIGIFDGTPILTCDQVVSLLSKDAIDGTKRAGDPIYNMVAQMVGAKLNLAAGAGSCAALNTALAQASALLVAIGFDGDGFYKDSGLTAQQRADAITLAGILGSYNEGTLGGGCPTHV